MMTSNFFVNMHSANKQTIDEICNSLFLEYHEQTKWKVLQEEMSCDRFAFGFGKVADKRKVLHSMLAGETLIVRRNKEEPISINYLVVCWIIPKERSS